MTFDENLVELDFGDLEGLTFDEARAKHPLAARRFLDGVTVAAPGGESIADVSARVARARRRILSEHAGRTVLVVSHVTPIKLMLAAGLGVGDEVVHHVFLEAASLSTDAKVRLAIAGPIDGFDDYEAVIAPESGDDIDDPVLFRKWVDKGNAPLLADRWRELEGCLVSVRGAGCPLIRGRPEEPATLSGQTSTIRSTRRCADR